jgi:regulatory protein
MEMGRTITALKMQKKNPQRVNVYLDGDFAFGLSKLVAAWLKVGQELNEEKINTLLSEDELDMAYQRALHFIHYRERSEAEIQRYLIKKEISESVIDLVLDKLRNAGLVNDQRFAQMWVENRSEFHPRSPRMMAMELQRHGIPREQIDEALEDVNQEALAYQVAVKQSSRYTRLEWQDFRTRLYGFLARRGFSYEIIVPIIKQVWEENMSNDHQKITHEEVRS